MRDGRSIPELRGMNAIPRDRMRPYSANSYAAQYGITTDDAQDMIDGCETHQQVERMILASFLADPDLKRRALMVEGTIELTEEELRLADRAKRYLGDKDSGNRAGELTDGWTS